MGMLGKSVASVLLRLVGALLVLGGLCAMFGALISTATTAVDWFVIVAVLLVVRMGRMSASRPQTRRSRVS